MSALPKQLVAMPKPRQVAGIKSQTIEISPTNGSFATSYAPQDRIIFQIPAYPNGFLNTKKSFIKFKPTLSNTGTGVVAIADGLPIFERMIVKSGSGAVLEDIQDVDLLDSLLESLSDRTESNINKALRGDHLAVAARNTRQAGNFVVRSLPGGLLGEAQEFYLPLHLMGGPYALEVELVLNSTAKCLQASADTVAAPAYTISGVTLQLEIVNMAEDVCKKLDAAVCAGDAVSVPFSTYRSYRNTIPSGATTQSLQIHEVSPNVEEVMCVLEKTTAKAVDDTRYESVGGSEGAANVVDEYQFRYADRYMPLQPVKDLANGSAPALANLMRSVPNNSPHIAHPSSTTGVPHYFKDKFFILQNMETDKELISGLSTQAHSGPIETFLKFSAGTNAAIRATQFAKSSHNLSVGKDGVAGLGMVM